MKNFKRDFFFWIEKLQITRSERLVISSLLVLVVLLWSGSFFLKQKQASSQENYKELRAEFERKSAALKLKQEQELQKYSPNPDNQSPDETEQITSSTVTVNINTAGMEELQSLKGIGATYAQRIIDYRQKNGEFNSAEELLNIKGIGKKRLEAIKPFITLE